MDAVALDGCLLFLGMRLGQKKPKLPRAFRRFHLDHPILTCGYKARDARHSGTHSLQGDNDGLDLRVVGQAVLSELAANARGLQELRCDSSHSETPNLEASEGRSNIEHVCEPSSRGDACSIHTVAVDVHGAGTDGGGNTDGLMR